MQYLQELDDLNPENRTFALNNDSDEIHFFAYSGKTLNNNDEKQKETNLYYGRYFLRKGFNQSIEDLDENVVKPLFVDQNGQDYYPLPQENVRDLMYADKLGIKGFAYSPNATQEQKDIEFEKIASAFVNASKNLDFEDEKNLFSISHNFYEVNYNNGGNEDFESSDILNKLRVETPRFKALKTAQMQKVALKKHIERRKKEIRERLSKTSRDEYGNVEVFGVVKADKHAEKIINDDREKEYAKNPQMRDEVNEGKSVDLASHIEQRKQEIRERLSKTPKDVWGDVKVSGVVEVDRKAADIIWDNWLDNWEKEHAKNPQMRDEVNEGKSVDLASHIEQRKQEIRNRLSKRQDEDELSGVVVADKIAEGKINGIIDEPVTPEKGKKLSDGIKSKIISKRRLSR